MYPKAKYHLYETQHTGMNPNEPVNLVPRTWTKRTVTDGEWMTNRTLDALDKRDYFLANVLDVVDKDKADHYRGDRGIVVDNANRTIYFSYKEEYEVDNNSGLSSLEASNFIYTTLPESVNGVENKLYINNGYVDYYVEPLPQPQPNTARSDTNTSETHTGFSGGNLNTFPTGANVIYVSEAKFKTDYTTIDGGLWEDKDAGCQWNWSTSSKDTWPASTGTAPTPTANTNTSMSSKVFNPSDRTITNDLTGGMNFISGGVDMVPTGVLFIY